MILRVEDDGRYSLSEPNAGIEMRADHLRRDHRSGEIFGELSVSLAEHSARTDNLLHVATFNFSSAPARTQRANIIRQRGGPELAGVNVAELLEALCQYIGRQERTGDPAVVLRDVPSRRPDETHFDVLGMRLPLKHLAILFGAGGTMKSYLALFIALVLALRGLRVLFIDWELDAEDHRYRLGCLADSLPDGILYCRARRPLVQEIDRLRRIGKAERIDYYILDSVGYGTAGDPAAADAAMDFCRAAGQLSGGVLALAHITKNGETNDQMPYGSVFWHNSARWSWNLKQSTESSDGRIVTLGAFNRKANLGRRLAPVSIEVLFAGDRVTLRQTDPGDVPDFTKELPTWQRMVSLLKGGPLTIAELSLETGKAPEAIKKAVQRGGTLFTKLDGGMGIPPRIALLEGRAS